MIFDLIQGPTPKEFEWVSAGKVSPVKNQVKLSFRKFAAKFAYEIFFTLLLSLFRLLVVAVPASLLLPVLNPVL